MRTHAASIAQRPAKAKRPPAVPGARGCCVRRKSPPCVLRPALPAPRRPAAPGPPAHPLPRHIIRPA
ncbi:hypothetical protein DESPIG_01754 [Desulfovibrio piger ATCC 29098]|uniref:Uncharacterized protein n=1 Tax=Desulfovibrio piger ATCC 29098 TaxID=411464 RepID=B6WUL2_9BACT|nr:hypothetical protein DESPIG_01754 [Desulfovibrio piger ATCC 29098]